MYAKAPAGIAGKERDDFDGQRLAIRIACTKAGMKRLRASWEAIGSRVRKGTSAATIRQGGEGALHGFDGLAHRKCAAHVGRIQDQHRR